MKYSMVWWLASSLILPSAVSLGDPGDLISVGCGCNLNGYTRQWEFTRQTTVQIDGISGRIAYLTGPEYPNDVVRAYAVGDAGRQACQDLAQLHLKETLCGYQQDTPYSKVDGTIADIEKKYGAKPLPLMTDPAPPRSDKCLNVAGRYRYGGLKSCDVLTSTMDYHVSKGNPYYLPFPFGRTGAGEIEIRQNGCDRVRVITNDPDPTTYPFDLTGATPTELSYVPPETIDASGFDHLDRNEYFKVTAVGNGLRVVTGYWQNAGSAETATTSWASAECHLERISK